MLLVPKIKYSTSHNEGGVCDYCISCAHICKNAIHSSQCNALSTYPIPIHLSERERERVSSSTSTMAVATSFATLVSSLIHGLCSPLLPHRALNLIIVALSSLVFALQAIARPAAERALLASKTPSPLLSIRTGTGTARLPSSAVFGGFTPALSAAHSRARFVSSATADPKVLCPRIFFFYLPYIYLSIAASHPFL